MREGTPPPREAEAHESDGAKAPSVAEAPRASEAKATEARAPKIAEAAAAGTRAPRTIEATMAEAGAPETTEVNVIAAKPSAHEVEMKATEASVKELEEELARVAGDHDTFRSQAGEDTASIKALAGQLGTEQGAHQLMKGALDEALKAAEASWTEAVVWRGKVEELEGEASRAAEASQVEVQHMKEKAKASWVKAQRWREKAEASQVEAQRWREKAKELETEVARAAEASVAVQAVLETEIGEHKTLKSAARTACEALEVEGVQSGSSLGSRLIVLSGQAREQLQGVLHTGVKHALAVIASHYISVDLKAISDGYVLPDDDGEADEEVAKLMEAAEGLGTALAKLFEEESMLESLA
ncbi:uncharacterized protein [Miscanthus floridulus]|uniref:uncharacterized protein n=1 Tax=Miscanthus floridulus TaxID=154761 RepID=UPI00345902DF